ncbi:MAG TPA: hypothetical protein VF553_21700 [Pyrinomonadaceae bacterium]
MISGKHTGPIRREIDSAVGQSALITELALETEKIYREDGQRAGYSTDALKAFIGYQQGRHVGPDYI